MRQTFSDFGYAHLFVFNAQIALHNLSVSWLLANLSKSFSIGGAHHRSLFF